MTRSPQLIVVVRAPSSLATANPDEAQLLQHPVGGQILDIGPGNDAGEPQFAEPELNEGAACLGRQSLAPIGTGQIERQHPLARDHYSVVSAVRIDAAAADVAALRLEHCRPQTHRLRPKPNFLADDDGAE